MPWFNISILPKKTEKVRFKIILAAFAVVLIGAGVFSLLQMKKTVSTFSPSPPPKPEVKKEEIAPEIKEFGIKIDKIGVLAPVIKDVDGTKKSAYNKALQKGVAHYKGTALPEQGSNIFIFGHSSQILGKGPYAEVFARLNDLEKGDRVVIYFQGKEFEYSVFDKKVVAKDDVSVLKPTKKEQLTLMTCWPIGSNAKRLIIKSSLK